MFDKFIKFSRFGQSKGVLGLNPCFVTSRDYCNFVLDALKLKPTRRSQCSVAVFWDLDNKPPSSFPPYEACIKIKTMASSFGVVRHMVAYANQQTFNYVPKAVREQRKERNLLNQLENKGVIKPVEPYTCGVCGRRFYNNEKLVHHFKEIHEREHQKRMNQIESARGKRRVNLVAKYAMKMQKYKNAVRRILTPKVGYGLADELKRAGFWVRAVLDKPQAADVALRDHMIDVMDKRKAQCLVLVSDDSGFVDVVKEAKLRCLKTVVVGDLNDGMLKRVADAGFSWQEILVGKAKKEAPSVVGRWKDREILNRLEWKYNPEEAKKLFSASHEFDDCQSEDDYLDSDEDDSEIEDAYVVEGDDLECKEDKKGRNWWNLVSDSEASS